MPRTRHRTPPVPVPPRFKQPPKDPKNRKDKKKASIQQRLPPPPKAPGRADTNAPIPPAFKGIIARAIDHCLAPRTTANYRSAVKRFNEFCNTHDVDKSLRFPADESLLCAFAASRAGLRAGSSTANQIAALKTWHSVNNTQWNGGTRLAYVLRGVSNLAPKSSTRKIRPPVTTRMLRLLREGLDLDRPKDAAIFTTAVVAFWGQCRLGELLGQSRRKANNPALPSIQSIGKRFSALGSRELHLPRTKTSQRLGQKVILTKQADDIDPLRALSHLLRINGSPPSSTNIFTYPSERGAQFRAITKEEFLKACNQIWSANGIQRITGHSFRSGGTSELLDMGVAPEIVREMGRWKSDAFYRYWRGLGTIAAKHAENAHQMQDKQQGQHGRHPPIIHPRTRKVRVGARLAQG